MFPGTKVVVFDCFAEGTDNSKYGYGRYEKATVVQWYGFISKSMERLYGREAAKYPNCVDVIFDYDGRRSNGHFVDCVKRRKL